jgi:hypothetical protein
MTTSAPTSSQDLASVFDVIDVLANLGILAVAVYALIVATRQIAVNREQIQVDREMEAINAYEAYHHLSIEHPELCTDFDHTNCSPAAYSSYLSYVMSMLLTIGRIMTLFPNDQEWLAAFDDDVRMHQRFLCSKEFLRHEPSLDRRVANFIAQTASKYGWRYPYSAGTVRVP